MFAGVERRERAHRRHADAHLHRLPGDLAIAGRRGRAAEAGMSDARVETVLSPPGRRTDDGGRAAQAERVRHRAAQRAGRPRACSARTPSPARTAARPRTDKAVRVRLHRVQGASALPELSRAVRLFQVSLIVDATERPRFHPIPIADVRRETADAVSIAFDIPPDLRERFRYTPGQYLTVKTAVNGEEQRRTYSISSGLDEGASASRSACRGRAVLGVRQRSGCRPAT